MFEHFLQEGSSLLRSAQHTNLQSKPFCAQWELDRKPPHAGWELGIHKENLGSEEKGKGQ